jgi:hypothetical protein
MRPNWLKITDPADAQYDAGAPRYWAPWAGNDVSGMIGPDDHNDPSKFGTITVDSAADATKYRDGRRYLWTPL